MPHNLQFDHENTVNVSFLCINCGQIIQFNKPGVGNPCPVDNGGVWVAPDNPETWMGPCNDE